MNIENLKRALLAKAKELRNSQISKEEIAIERNAELLDEIQRTSDREIAMASLTRDWHTTAQVAAALQRIEIGEYGVCAQCEEAISERRLNAIPWAKFCIRCQEQVDLQFDRYEMSAAA